MTACFFNKMPNGNIYIAADTIATSTIPIKQETISYNFKQNNLIKSSLEERVQGVTSVGQRFSPLVGRNGVSYFTENAAKVGIVNKIFPFACAGCADSIFAFFRYLLRYESFLKDKVSLEKYIKVAASELFTKTKFNHFTVGFALRAEDSSGTDVGFLDLSPTSKAFSFQNLDRTNNPSIFIGSGAEKLRSGFSTNSIYQSTLIDPTLNKIILNMTLAGLSTAFSEPLTNPIGTDFFGGYFLGFGTTDTNLITPEPIIHFYINSNNVLHFAVKVSYKESLFYIHDMITGHTNVLETIDHHVRRPRPTTIPIRNIYEATKHQAKTIFITQFMENGIIENSIIGNGIDDALKPKIELVGKPPDSYDENHWFLYIKDFTIPIRGIPTVFKIRGRS